MHTLADLARRMQDLARHDTQRRVFGAHAHRWLSTPLTEEEVSAALARHGAEAPAAWRWWVVEGPGAGAGPFYGLRRPDEVEPADGELAGALPLTDQGCGYADWLQTRGERAGEVWIDLRASEGPVARWYPSLEAWLEAWLRRSHAEWGAAYLEGGVPQEADAAFLSAVEEALTWVMSAHDDPLNQQYPIGVDRAGQALAALYLAREDWDGATAAFDAAAAMSPQPEAARAVGRCRVAQARGDWQAMLAAADEGLGVPSAWWSTRGELLEHRAVALEGLERWDDGVAAREDIAAHFEDDVQRNLDVVWVRMLRGETDLAAKRVRELAARGVGCDTDVDEAERIRQVVGGLLDALRREDMAADADALAAALAGGAPGTADN